MHTKALGTIFVGDLNVHQRSWLHHFQRDSVEGNFLFEISQQYCLNQMVSEPTREGYLQDLFSSYMYANSTVLQQIAIALGIWPDV